MTIPRTVERRVSFTLLALMTMLITANLALGQEAPEPSAVLLPAVSVATPAPVPEATPAPANYPDATLAEGPDAEAESQVLPPATADLMQRGIVASLCVTGLLLMLRFVFAGVFAPEPSTDRSKGFNMFVAAASGVGFGLLGIAPSVGPGFAGQAVGGFLCACVAVFGRDALTRSVISPAKKRRAAP